MSGVLVLGAGGHAKVVADVLLCGGQAVIGFLDDNTSMAGRRVLGLPVLGAIESFAAYQPSGLIVGIGSNSARKGIVQRLGEAAAGLWLNAVHPRATVAASAVFTGAGVVVVAGAVVNPDARVGWHVIINTCASVDHDCVIGDFVHIAPGARLAGSVSIGEGVFVGAGAVVLPGRCVGAGATVGAGAVVVHDIPPGMIAKGVPARW